MLRHIAAVCFLAVVLLIPQAHAQCPAGTTNPLNAFVGAFTFELDGFYFPPTIFLASSGRLVTSLGTDRGGNTIGAGPSIQSSSRDGSPTRLENDAVSFQVFPDCSAVAVTINVSSGPIQLDC